MSMVKTLELRLRIPASALPALRAHPLLRAAAPRAESPAIEDLYQDTPNLRLRARRVALALRDDGRAPWQCIAISAPECAGLGIRSVLTQPHAGTFDFSTLDDPELARFLDRHAGRLAPVFRVRYRRQPYCCTLDAGTRIRLSIDDGAYATEEDERPLTEVVLSAEAADPADLLAFAARLAADLPLLPTDLSRAETGYRVLARETPQPLRAEDSALQGADTVTEAYAALAAASTRHWQGNAEAALDQGAGADPEFVHQIRVALRRLRSALRVFEPALPESFTAEWRPRLGDHARGLDAARDLEVFRAELLEPVVGTGLIEDQALDGLRQRLETARQAALEGAGAGLDQAREGRLILEWAVALRRLPSAERDAAPDAGSEPGSEPGSESERGTDLRTFAVRRLRGLRRRARRRFTAAADLAPPALHRLRIGLKDLRYAVEFFAPLLPERPLLAYLELLTRVQASLGFLHDLDVARTRLETWAAEDPALAAAAGFVLGWHAPRYTRLRRRVLRDCAPVLWGRTPWK